MQGNNNEMSADLAINIEEFTVGESSGDEWVSQSHYTDAIGNMEDVPSRESPENGRSHRNVHPESFSDSEMGSDRNTEYIHILKSKIY